MGVANKKEKRKKRMGRLGLRGEADSNFCCSWWDCGANSGAFLATAVLTWRPSKHALLDDASSDPVMAQKSRFSYLSGCWVKLTAKIRPSTMLPGSGDGFYWGGGASLCSSAADEMPRSLGMGPLPDVEMGCPPQLVCIPAAYNHDRDQGSNSSHCHSRRSMYGVALMQPIGGCIRQIRTAPRGLYSLFRSWYFVVPFQLPFQLPFHQPADATPRKRHLIALAPDRVLRHPPAVLRRASLAFSCFRIGMLLPSYGPEIPQAMLLCISWVKGGGSTQSSVDCKAACLRFSHATKRKVAATATATNEVGMSNQIQKTVTQSSWTSPQRHYNPLMPTVDGGRLPAQVRARFISKTCDHLGRR